MRFRPADLRGIEAGEITLAFRRWTRPRVLTGTRLHTPIGLVAVDEVSVVDAIGEEDARAAGYESAAAANAAWAHRAGALHRIALHVAGPDPRIALRESPPDDVVFVKLERLPWALDVLRAIDAHPGLRAPDLAAAFGRETVAFKRDVRRLKELGLTESLKIGYRLSARGRAVLKRLS